MTRCVSGDERDDEHGRRGLARIGLQGAPITAAILIANVLVFVGQLAYLKDAHVLSGMTSGDPVEAARLTRAILASGANYPPFVFGELRVETLLTSCFVHFSLMHIAFNMAALRQMGGVVERTVGQARLASMYVASGIVGAAASAAWGWFGEQERLSAGASGAICGVLGAALVLGVRLQGWRGPIVRAMLTWLALTIGLGFFIGSDNAAHVGGTVTGAAFAIAWRPGVVYSRGVARGLVAGPLLLIVASGLLVLVRDLTDPFATLDLEARLARAQTALDGADCVRAIEATERAAHLAPRSSRVLDLKRTILIGCRPSR